MKKLLYLFTIMLVVACSSNDDPITAAPTNNNGITELNATGTVSEQTPAEAKITIYGKWDFSGNQRLMTNTCTFNFLEFMDEIYIMSFIVNGDTETFSGTYVLNEDSDGTVSSVDLKLDIEGVLSTIATLTDVVVTETDDTISATFNIVLNIPTNFENYEICNGLDGDYEVDKDEPMTESTSASGDSNHSKLIKTWNFVSRYQFNEDASNEWYQDPCIIENEEGEEDTYIEGCTAATDVTISISAYGTYTFTWTGSNQGVKTETDVWEWSDSSQNAFLVGEDQTMISIIDLTDTSAVFTEDDDENEGDDDLITYTLTANLQNQTGNNQTTSVTDIDGNTYDYITYGDQVWTVDNAAMETYRDGTPIPQVTGATEWSNLTTGAWCYYNNDPTKPRFYNWYAVMGMHDTDPDTPNKEFAPDGWHVPSDAEWTTLENHLIANSYNYDQTNTGNKIAKSMASNTGWVFSSTEIGAVSNDQSLNNSSEFNAFPEATRINDGSFDSDGEGFDTIFWSSTVADSGSWYRALNYESSSLGRGPSNNQSGFSVRFVRD